MSFPQSSHEGQRYFYEEQEESIQYVYSTMLTIWMPNLGIDRGTRKKNKNCQNGMERSTIGVKIKDRVKLKCVKKRNKI